MITEKHTYTQTRQNPHRKKTKGKPSSALPTTLDKGINQTNKGKCKYVGAVQ